MPTIQYPDTKRGNVVEQHFGQAVADPYRWLEEDFRSDAGVAEWIKAQNKLTDSYLAALPGRDVFRARLTALFDYERVSQPHERGGRYFYSSNSGLQSQDSLVVRDGVDGVETVLIDPSSWSGDGTTALAQWAASNDGTLVAYAVQQDGTDWRTIKVMEVDTGKVRDDKVERARFTNISWARDGGGFFYSRYPDPEPGASSQAGVTNHAVYYHALGTSQSQDRLVYANPDQPNLLHFADVSDDGRYAFIYPTPGSGANALVVIGLTTTDWKPRVLIDNQDAEWRVLGNVGTKLFVLTSKGAERRKIVTLDLADASPTFKDLVVERNEVLTSAWLIGERLIATYLVDAKTEVRRFGLDGTPDGAVELPGIGSAGGFVGHAQRQEAFFIFSSYNVPITVYRYDARTNTSRVWSRPNPGFDPDRFAVEERFYTSKDGTRVPLFIVRRKDLVGPAPTLLYGYGGFGISMVPVYNPAHMAWVEQGGVLAVANIRGGGEYGKAWHDAGRLANKQNSFDDFIAAGEYLKAQGFATADGLVIHGQSGGGLLVGAVVNQRPDLFAAALPGVGVMDMLRYHRFTGGHYWMTDFGDPATETAFRDLRAYSPYHNVRAGTDYPAILATTADSDDRVVPGHSFKYIAAIQGEDVGSKPHLVRIETQAGHGAGTSITKVIEETADMWAFAAHWAGLKMEAPE